MQEMFTGVPFITSFGEDDRGNLYFTRSSSLFQIVPWSALPVPPDSSALDFIERLYASGVTAGCGGDDFCAAAATTREQMAALVLRAADQTFVPPPCDAREVQRRLARRARSVRGSRSWRAARSSPAAAAGPTARGRA